MPSGNNYSWNDPTTWSKLGTSQGNTRQTHNQQSTTNTTTNSNTYPPANQWGRMNQKNQNSNVSGTQASNGQHNAGAANSSESRKDMITRLYTRLLGREPDSYGLNYYLYNTKIDELQMTKEMYESEEHADILDKAKDVRTMVMKLDFNLKEVRNLKSRLADLEGINTSYKKLLQEKDKLIANLPEPNDSIDSEDVSTLASGENNNKKYNHQSNAASLSQFGNNPPTQINDEDKEVLDDPFAEIERRNSGNFMTRLFKGN